MKGSIEVGKYADLITIDLNNPSLKLFDMHVDANTKTNDAILNALIFGCDAKSVVADSCVHGKWEHYHILDSITKPIIQHNSQQNNSNNTKVY